MDKRGVLAMFKRKYQDQAIDIAKKYLTGIIDFEEFVNILIKNEKLLKYFISFIKQNSGRNFPSKEELMIINNTYWQRHDFYNIMYSYLFVQDIKVDKYATEYNNFKKLEKVCPEWFQNDIIFLQNTFKDLDEIIQSNKLEERLIQLCKCENHIFPVWLQGPMWPIIDGKPAKFIGQSKLPDELEWNDIEICYYFKDFNGKEITIKQST